MGNGTTLELLPRPSSTLLIIKEIRVESRKVIENTVLIRKAEGRRFLRLEFP